ncbi:MAG: hypothetical protein KDD47_06810, partial [Acidobacteria bacterium]|nr:hypothetical protein [Acidobacteriota bacterium]
STQEAVKIFRELAAQRPNAFLSDLARSLGLLSQAHLRRGDYGEAAKAAKERAHLLFSIFSRYRSGLSSLMSALLRT